MEIEHSGSESLNPKSTAPYVKLEKSSKSQVEISFSEKLEPIVEIDQEDLYFKSDAQKKPIGLNASSDYGAIYDSIQEINISFHPRQFFETFFCHVLHNIFFGPFSIPIMWIIFPRVFIKNMAFWPKISIIYISQLILWACFCIFFVGATILPQPDDHYQPSYVLTTVIVLINITLRQIIVCLKYGYYTEDKYSFFKEYPLPEASLMKEDSRWFWNKKSNNLLIKEIYYALHLNAIEPSLFYLKFIIEPKEEVNKRLKKIENIVETQIFCSSEVEISSCDPLQDLKKTRYFAGTVIYDMIDRSLSSTTREMTKWYIWFFIASFCGSLYPYFLYIDESDITNPRVEFSIRLPTDFLGIIAALGFVASNTMCQAVNLSIFSLSVINTRMRYNLIKQITYMVNPRVNSLHDEAKLYPTLNLFDTISLKTWSQLRRIAVDYARKYKKRAEAGASCQLIFYAVLMLYLIIQIFANSNMVYANYHFIIILICLFAQTIFLTGYMMVLTAWTNESYWQMKNHVKGVKDILSDFIIGRDHLLSEKASSNNLLYRVCLHRLILEFGHLDNQQFTEKSIKELRNLTSCMDDMINEICFDETNYPAKVMGIALTPLILKRLTTTLLSVTFSILTYLVHLITKERIQD